MPATELRVFENLKAPVKDLRYSGIGGEIRVYDARTMRLKKIIPAEKVAQIDRKLRDLYFNSLSPGNKKAKNNEK